MSKLNIRIIDNDSGETEEVDCEGYLLLYLKGEKIKIQGKLDMKTLAPILTRIALEKMSR